MSVAALVEKKKEAQTKRLQRNENKELKRIKNKNEEQFKNEVQDIIDSFESKCFNIKSGDNKVAEFIFNGGRSKLACSRQPFQGIQFESSSFPKDRGYKLITTCEKFTQWKKAMEDKFGIEIYIRKDYKEHKRFGNSGFETFPDYTYEGVIAIVYISDED